MVRKLVLLLVLICGVESTRAQIARWTLHPDYDSVEPLENGLYKVSRDGKYGLMAREDRKILPIEYDSIMPFRCGYAVVYKNKSKEINGFCYENGTFVDLSKKHYTIDNDYPYFENGILLVRRDNDYYFIDSKGRESQPFAYAQPFFHGYAVIRVYKDLEKKGNNTYLAYLGPDCKIATLSGIDNSDLDFVSSVSKGKSIVVCNKKFYEFDIQQGTLKQLYTDTLKIKKNMVTGAASGLLPTKTKEGNYVVSAKNAQYVFDKYMRLRASNTRMGRKTHDIDVEEKKVIVSAFDIIDEKETGLAGLMFGQKEVLPPQFKDVTSLESDEAVVQTNDGWGVVVLEKDDNFNFKLNNNENIGFLHDKFNAKLTMTMPTHIRCSLASVESKSDDCVISVETRNDVENSEISSINYMCTLSIPEEITDQVQDISYEFAVKYDGLKSRVYEVVAKEWYIKNYVVERTKTNISGGRAEIEFTLKEEQPSVTGNYFKDVTINTEYPYYCDSIPVKITENKYVAHVSNLSSGLIPFKVNIKEGNCPTVNYDLDFSAGGRSSSSSVPEVSSGRVTTRRITSSRKHGGKQPPKTTVVVRPKTPVFY